MRGSSQNTTHRTAERESSTTSRSRSGANGRAEVRSPAHKEMEVECVQAAVHNETVQNVRFKC